MDQNHLPGDEPADFKQDFVRSENEGCKVQLLTISFRSILVAEIRIGVIWSGNLAIY